MNASTISIIIFACVFGGALAGTALRAILPEHHLSSESKDVVKLSMGLVATMSALVLGLLVASAKSSYDTQSTEITDLSARVILLDRMLAHYGPETKELRASLKVTATAMAEHLDPPKKTPGESVAAPTTRGELPYDLLQALAPPDDSHRMMKEEITKMMLDLGKERWLMFEQGIGGFEPILLIIVVSWLTIIFTSFGLYAKPNGLVTVSLAIAAFSVSTAIFLILEMYSPYGGLIHVSIAPLREAISHLGL